MSGAHLGAAAARTGTAFGKGLAASTAIVMVLILSSASTAHAADRPSEEDMFGGEARPQQDGGVTSSTPDDAVPAAQTDGGGLLSPSQTGSAAIPAPPPSVPRDRGREGPPEGPAGGSRDELVLGDPNAGPRLSEETAPEDPLKIGGQLYLRALSQAKQGQAVEDWRFSAPSLVDAYFDARPNDRVRGFVLGRMQFDSTLPTSSTPAAAQSDTMANGSLGFTVPLLSGVQNTRGPSTLLDQLWLRFDIYRTLFITAGRQHVKWGTGRFWSPTDFLHPQQRNPVAVFDARPGFTMLKVHLPWEEKGWNFYGFALVEGTRQINHLTGRYPAEGSDAANTLGQIGAAARAEIVLGVAELGLDVVGYRGQRARFGGDLSFGVGDLDLYVDAGFRYGEDLARRTYDPNATLPVVVGAVTAEQFNQWVDQKWPVDTTWSGIKPQITLGGTYSLKYNDNDVFTVTGEYFYNSRGYSDPHVYPGLFFTNSFDFFYTGRHYAALGAILAAPWSWNYTTFTLSTLGNLSDQSFMTLLNYSLVVLTHLRFEAFGAANYGRREGEFRLGSTEVTLPGNQPFSLAPQSFSFGLGLRISI